MAVNPQELVGQVCGRVRDFADTKDVDIVLDCICRQAYVHPQTFSEALYELLDNAVRATRRHHPVMVDVRNTSEGDVLWQIQDTGEGIPEKILAELGQPLPAISEVGPGLGVAFAWAVVEKHGGLLRFESAPGVGTTATIWLPCTPLSRC